MAVSKDAIAHGPVEEHGELPKVQHGNHFFLNPTL